METSAFLAEFPPVTTAAWEEAIRADLKGSDPATLVWRAEPGLEVKPFYRAEDLAGISFAAALPGEFPDVRGTAAHRGWRIREEVRARDAEEANDAARAAVQAGAQQIAFAGVRIETASDVAVLLSGLEGLPVHFAEVDASLVRMLIERMEKRRHGAVISAGMDAAQDWDAAAEILAHMPLSLEPFTIAAEEWHDRGATAAEQIGFALAAGVDLLAHMSDRGIAVDTIAQAVGFSFATGPAYLIEIAKLRAVRLVWAQAVEAFGGSRKHARARIHARTARWNQTIYDSHVNALRAATEAMAAVLGGADAVTVLPFDECLQQSGEAARRLARNTQLILRDEAMLGRVADPAGGSYAIESLTHSLAAQGWKLMQQFEDAGGFSRNHDAVSATLRLRAGQRDKGVVSRKLVLTGTNRFADPAEKVAPAVKPDPGRTAHALEELRLRTQQFIERGGAVPRIVLAQVGDAKMRAARSQFAADFLACAGLTAEIACFTSARDIAAVNAGMIVLCSSDAEYLAIARELFAALTACGRTTPVIIAGNPETAAELTERGVAEFIHLRSEPLLVLGRLQQRLGIRE